MKITRYLWINNLSNHCEENDIRQTFQSHGKIQTIRIHKNNNSRGAIVAFIDCKSSTKAYESVKTLMDMPLKLEYCESNGEPGINGLGNSYDNQKTNAKNNQKPTFKTSISSRSRSNSSNTSSFGSSIDDCSKYPAIQPMKRVDENSNNYESNDIDRNKTSSSNSESIDNDKQCLNKDLCGLLIENLSQRSSDTSLREGLFHEYKKHGKITSVTVMGQASGRYAIISFKRSEDMEKAFEASIGKIFFGNQIKAKQHNGFNYIDPDLCPPEHAMDEYHPKATKTLFVGKLTTGSVTETDLKKSFKKYGEIIDIDIKTQSNQPDTSFAFVQYYDISSVVRALRNQDNIKIDGKSVKLGFGKSQPTNCLWIGNLQRNATDAFMRRHFRRYGPIVLVIPDPEYACALIQFDCVEDAQRALTDTRERSNGNNNNNNNNNKRMQVDYASNEYQMAFMNRLRKSCQFDSHDLLKNYADPYQTEKIQNLLISYTKYLGLLEESRPQSFDRYENKSDYEDYDEIYPARQSRHRKSGHQRAYGDNYNLDDDYSDDYRYTKPNIRHYDEYSPTHSPVRYSRSSQKFTEPYTNVRKSSNYRYNNNEYYDTKHEQVSSSNSYYPHHRSPEAAFVHSNHNRSYSPSPSSSVDYCVDNNSRGFNLTSKRYRQTSKDYRSSRSKVADSHEARNSRYERTPDNRSWNKSSNRYDYDGYIAQYRSKSGSRSRLSGSNSPPSRNSASQQRNYRNDSVKKTTSRTRKTNNSDQMRLSMQKSSNQKSAISNIKLPASNYITKTSNEPPIVAAVDTTKISPEATNIINTASQSADTLSKLERERAKLLQELSMLSEEATSTTIGKTIKSNSKVNNSDQETRSGSHKSHKKLVSPVFSEHQSLSKRTNNLDAIMANTTIPTMNNDCIANSLDNHPVVVEKSFKIAVCIPATNVDVNIKVESIYTSPSLLASSEVDLLTVHSSASNGPVIAPLATIPIISNIDIRCTSANNANIPANNSPSNSDIFNQCRDPRLACSNYHTRPSLPPLICSLSPCLLDHTLSTMTTLTTSSHNVECSNSFSVTTVAMITDPVTPSALTSPTMTTTSTTTMFSSSLSSTNNAYKDSTSDSDLEHFSNIDSELDKRIRELDAKMNRSEQTVRTLDYSKFRIRKKVCDNVGNGSSMSYNSSSNNHTNNHKSSLVTSPTCLTSPISMSSMSVTSSLLDVGYSTINRDNNSNTSEFIKTMLNQTKLKSYHLLTDSLPSSDHLTCNYPSVVSTNSSSLSFRTVDLGANDIERRTLFSRYGSINSSNLPLLDTKLSVDTTHLSPTINTYNSRFVSTTSCSISSSKMPSTLTISPTATISSTTSTPTILHDLNHPMKSILKKSMPATSTPMASSAKSMELLSSAVKYKSSLSQDCSTTIDNQMTTNHNSVTGTKTLSKKLSSNSLKRKSQSESEDSVEYSKPYKKIKMESGPVLDDSLFQTYPSAPIKKVKKSSKNVFSTLPSSYVKYEAKDVYVAKKSSSINSISLYNNSNRNSTSNHGNSDKVGVSKKSAKMNQSNHSNQKSTKVIYKDQKKSNSKLSINKKPKSKVNLKPIDKNRKNKIVKTEKVKKSGRRNKEREFYENIHSDNDGKDDIEDDNNEDLSDFDDDFDKDSGSSDLGNYESMYDKIKRRNSKKSVSSGKKRRSKHVSSLTNAGSSDAMDSDDSEYWVNKSSKKSSPIKRKRARLSDLSSSHFSDSNSCKTTPCGKSQEPHLSSDYSDIKSEITNQNNFYNIKTTDENTKDESVTDESKAPAESFNLSSPHNSSQCSSPKYSKDLNPVTNNREIFESNNTITQSMLSFKTRSQHRPNEGPLKKRPIAEPILLSEDLPYLEKQADEEFIASSPTSINEEPPSQLESMYDMPSSQQTNVMEEVILDDHLHSLDVVEVEYGLQDVTNDQNQIDLEPPLPADVDSASHILMTMKTQPNIEIEYNNVTTTNSDPDQQVQSVAEQLISLAQNSIVSTVSLPQTESAVMVTEDDKQSQIASSRACKVTNVNSKQKDYEVTIYVKNIIDKIKKETDLANSLNKDKLLCKRTKKTSTFNMTLAKPATSGAVVSNQDGRQVTPLDVDVTSNRVTTTLTAVLTTCAPVVLSAMSPIVSGGGGLCNNIYQPPEQSQCQAPQLHKGQFIKQIETKKSSQLEDTASTPSTGRRTRHNSAKSDSQLQSLDETIDNVVKSSMSSSISDAVSNKSTLDGDINGDNDITKTNLGDNGTTISTKLSDLSSLEETMNEVIHKMSITNPTVITTSVQTAAICEMDMMKSINNNAKMSISNLDLNKHQKKMNMNHVKQPMYQMSGIANLVLGIPSILTVNTLVNQQNQINQNKISASQLTLPLGSKLAVSTIQSNIVSASSLVPSSITLHNQHTSVTSVQSTEVMLTKLNSLTPIVIPAPLRNLTPMGQNHTNNNNNNLSSPSLIASRPMSNSMCGTIMSVPNCNTSQDNNNPSKQLINVSLTANINNKPITSPINVIPRSPITPSSAMNLSKLSASSVDALNNYFMMQRQASQTKQKLPNMCQQQQSASNNDINVSQNVTGLTASISNSGHSIILSQLTHANSVLSPITTAYLTTSINRPNANLMQSNNGMVATGMSNTASSLILRPVNIPFPKFEEKNDWLKQNKQSELNYPIRWTGKLCLKNDEVFVQMHMLAGNEDLIKNSMNLISNGQILSQPLRIVQRMRLEPNQLEGLQRRLTRQLEFCTCLTLAGGDKSDELDRTSSILNDNFIKYLQEKSAAGIINICIPDSQQNAYVIHIFPPCEFSDNQLKICSSKLYETLKEESVPYLLVVITTV